MTDELNIPGKRFKFDCDMPIEDREQCQTSCVMWFDGDIAYCGSLKRINFEKTPSHKLEEFDIFVGDYRTKTFVRN